MQFLIAQSRSLDLWRPASKIKFMYYLIFFCCCCTVVWIYFFTLFHFPLKTVTPFFATFSAMIVLGQWWSDCSQVTWGRAGCHLPWCHEWAAVWGFLWALCCRWRPGWQRPSAWLRSAAWCTGGRSASARARWCSSSLAETKVETNLEGETGCPIM